MDSEQQATVKALVELNLDRAESTWNAVGHQLKKALATEAMDSATVKKAETVPSKIPGHELVSDDIPLVDEFIAINVDMRDSTKHLLQAISHKQASVSQLQRVYYETSALLPALALTIRFQEGQVTEYLGDGVLALFRVDKNARDNTIYSAYYAGRDCITQTRKIVNDALRERYRLPELNIGVGMSYSKALITLVGLEGEKQPKAIGECVYRASKLSKGVNEIVIDDWLNETWPQSKGGTIRFMQRMFDAESGYVLSSPSLSKATSPMFL